MSFRTAPLLALRPRISADVHPDATPIEAFQTQTLRPILKFQHDLLGMALMRFLAETRQTTTGKTPDQQATIIAQALQNKALHHTLIGMVTGLMTVAEYAFYTQHTRELNRRVTGMLAQRLADFVSKDKLPDETAYLTAG